MKTFCVLLETFNIALKYSYDAEGERRDKPPLVERNLRFRTNSVEAKDNEKTRDVILYLDGYTEEDLGMCLEIGRKYRITIEENS